MQNTDVFFVGQILEPGTLFLRSSQRVSIPQRRLFGGGLTSQTAGGRLGLGCKSLVVTPGPPASPSGGLGCAAPQVVQGSRSLKHVQHTQLTGVLLMFVYSPCPSSRLQRPGGQDKFRLQSACKWLQLTRQKALNKSESPLK